MAQLGRLDEGYASGCMDVNFTTADITSEIHIENHLLSSRLAQASPLMNLFETSLLRGGDEIDLFVLSSSLLTPSLWDGG